jgi:hypothetical protein
MLAGVGTSQLREAEPDGARLPPYTVLGSERGLLLPPLEDAIQRYVRLTRDQPALACEASPA